MNKLKCLIKIILTFLIASIISFYIISSKNLCSLCRDKQLNLFDFCGWKDGSSLDQFKINGLGAAINDFSTLTIENNNNFITDIEDYSKGYAVYQELQIDVFKITNGYKLSILIGLIYTLISMIVFRMIKKDKKNCYKS